MELDELKDKYKTVSQQLVTLQANVEQGRGYLKCLADMIALKEQGEPSVATTAPDEE